MRKDEGEKEGEKGKEGEGRRQTEGEGKRVRGGIMGKGKEQKGEIYLAVPHSKSSFDWTCHGRTECENQF